LAVEPIGKNLSEGRFSDTANTGKEDIHGC
jgi:hypothetical protein